MAYGFRKRKICLVLGLWVVSMGLVMICVCIGFGGLSRALLSAYRPGMRAVPTCAFFGSSQTDASLRSRSRAMGLIFRRVSNYGIERTQNHQEYSPGVAVSGAVHHLYNVRRKSI